MAKKKKKAKDDDVKPKKGKKAKPVEEELEEEEGEYSPDDAAKPRLDIYVGLSTITLLVLIAAAVFFYMDVDASKGKTPPAVAVNVGSLDGRTAPAPR